MKKLTKNQRRRLKTPVTANGMRYCVHGMVVHEEVSDGRGRKQTVRYTLHCQIQHTYKQGSKVALEPHKVAGVTW